MATIYLIEGLVPTSERYQKYYWLKYIESTSQRRWLSLVKAIYATLKRILVTLKEKTF